MDKSTIVSIILAVICAAVFGAKVYFQTRGSVFESASQLIAEIESSGLIGKEKMAFVVGKLVELIPIPLKTIFTAERLEKFAQEVFENMKQYALERAKRMDEEGKKKEEIPPEEEKPAEEADQ